MKPFRVTSLVLAASLAAVAGLTFHRVFGLAPVAGAVLGAAVIATGLAWLLGDRFNQRLLVTAPASVLAFFVYAALTQFGAPGPAAIGNVLDGLVNGWADTLSSTIPTAATGERLTFVIAVVWIAAFAGAELTLRTRGVVLPLLPATVGFFIAIGFGAGAPGQGLGEGLTFALLAATYILLRANASDAQGAEPERHAGPAARHHLAVGGGVLLAIVAVGALLVVVIPVTDGRTEYDPRRAAPQPQVRLAALNPLDTVTGIDRIADGDEDPVLFTAEVTASNPQALENPWRLAVLDHYDGVNWSYSSEYDQSGTTVPPDDDVDLPMQTVSQDVTIKELTGPWLPARDRPARVVRGDVRFGEAGVLVARGGQVKEGLRYTVESAIPAPDAVAKALATAKPSGEDRYKQLPDGVPAALTLAPLASGGSAVEQVVSLARQYSDTYTLQKDASPGHTLRHLEEFAKARAGTAEQFVAAYAVQARALGYATRVVIGYESHDCSGACEVHQSDLIAWPEVRFDGVGWQRMSAVPSRAVEDPPEEEPVTTTTPIQNVADDQRNDAGAGAGNSTSAPASGNSFWRIVLAGMAVLFVTIVGSLWFRTVKTARRSARRRSAADPAARIAGAWHESLDRVVRLGLRPRRFMSASQLVEAAVPLLDDSALPHLRRLGDLETSAQFDSVPPTVSDADLAWRDADAIAATIDAQSTRRSRLSARLDTRTVTALRGYPSSP